MLTRQSDLIVREGWLEYFALKPICLYPVRNSRGKIDPKVLKDAEGNLDAGQPQYPKLCHD